MNKDDCLTGLTLYKGNSSEAVVLAAYTKAGFIVSFPFEGGAAYDLIVDNGARLIRVQVKTGRLSGGCVTYNTRRHRGSRLDTFRRYEEGEVDIFAVCCLENEELFAVPAEQSLNIEGRLRILGTKNSQEKKIRWAQVYTWEKHISQLKAERRQPNKFIGENGLP